MIPTRYNPRPDLVQKARAALSQNIHRFAELERFPGQTVHIPILTEFMPFAAIPDQLVREGGRFFFVYWSQTIENAKPRKTVVDITP